MSESGKKHLFNGLVKGSNTITKCCQLGVCMYAPRWISSPACALVRTLTQTLLSTTLLCSDTLCEYPQARTSVCHLAWLSRQKRVETNRETKLAVASVSGEAGPWVRWAILTEGRERSPAPLVHKPFYRIPHRVLMASWECAGGVIQWQVWQKKRKWASGRWILMLTKGDFWV